MDDLRPVSPVRPPAAYVGGKKQLAARVVALMEQVRHVTYAEPFVGMGGVFLRRRHAARVEVINDVSGDVVTLFRILQRHYVAFMDMLRFQITSRQEFERLVKADPTTLTDLERAGRFLYLQRLAFGGKVLNRSFGVSPGLPGRFDVAKLGPLLSDIGERLSGVIIENLDWSTFLDRYDAPTTLFFLDPPYLGSEGYYGKGVFAPADHGRLAQRLVDVQGSFVLTINDGADARAIYGGFDVEEAPVTYTVHGTMPMQASELIVSRVRDRRAKGLFD